MKILCAGDLHIGRRPSRLPDRIDCGPLSCASAWGAIVDLAIEEAVDLVALSGDVVDQANRYYEAVGPLEAGIRKLAARGIRTVAVAGNHDHDVLPWLAESLPPEDFRLLGRGGRWERFTFERDGRPALHIDGWSFPQQRHPDDPLRGHSLEAGGAVPVLGLLHADLDAARSVYAPVALADLRSRPVGFWLLGHVHAPRHLQDGRSQVLYPGSPQAMDPGEPGVHGVWLLEIDGGGRFAARHIPLATVRYETLGVDLEDVADERGLGLRVRAAVQARLERCVDDGCGPLRYLALRLVLSGRTAVHRELEAAAGRIVSDLRPEHAGVMAVVERVMRATRPPLDLQALARAGDATGLLARLVLEIERNGGGSGTVGADLGRLVRAAARAATDARSAAAYSALPGEEAEMSVDEARRILADQALVLLDALLAQKEAA